MSDALQMLIFLVICGLGIIPYWFYLLKKDQLRQQPTASLTPEEYYERAYHLRDTIRGLVYQMALGVACIVTAVVINLQSGYSIVSLSLPGAVLTIAVGYILAKNIFRQKRFLETNPAPSAPMSQDTRQALRKRNVAKLIKRVLGGLAVAAYAVVSTYLLFNGWVMLLSIVFLTVVTVFCIGIFILNNKDIGSSQTQDGGQIES